MELKTTKLPRQRHTVCVHLNFLLKVSLKPAPAAMFTEALLVHWQESEGEGYSSEVFTALLTSLPAHWGSLITESFAYCPCLLLTLQTWCCSIHTVSASWKNSSRSCCSVIRGSAAAAQGQRSNTAEFCLCGHARYSESHYTKENNISFTELCVGHSVAKSDQRPLSSTPSNNFSPSLFSPTFL